MKGTFAPTFRFFWLMLVLLPVSAVPLFVSGSAYGLYILWAIALVFASIDLGLLAQLRPALRLEHGARAGVGDSIEMTLRAALRTPFPLLGDARLVVESPLVSTNELRVRLHPVDARVSFRVDAPHRGLGKVKEAWLRVEGPLRFFARTMVSREGCGDVLVLPNVARADKALSESVGLDAWLGGLKRQRWVGEGGEFDSLNAYTTGMDIRHADWKASARHQSMRVRRFRLERRQNIVMSIDVGRLMRDPIEGLERLDHAVHSAMAVSKAALRAGDLVGFHAYHADPQAWVPPRSGIGHYARLHAAASALMAEPQETNHVLGLHHLMSQLRKRSLVVVFTEFTDVTTAELLVEVLSQLVRKHVVIFMALEDPILELPFLTPPSNVEDWSRATIAAQLSQRRSQVLARLSKLGVHVVSTPVGPAAPSLLQQYIRIKERGLL